MQGVAGSGKTAIALHRAAYLLYRQPRMAASEILMLTPNEALADYVAEVLPDLNEAPLTALTWLELLRSELSGREGHFATLEPLQAPLAKRELASGMDFLAELRRYGDELAERAVRMRPLSGPNWRVETQDLQRFFDDNYGALPPLLRSRAMVDNVLDQLRADGVPIRRVRPEVERQLAEMNRLSRLSQLLLDFVRWYDQRHPEAPYPLSGDAGRDEGEGEGQARRPKLRVMRTRSDGSVELELDTEAERLQGYDLIDLCVLTWLKLAAYGPDEQMPVQHLIVDEMQDLPLVAHDCLATLYRCPATVLGDVNQALAYTPAPDWLDQLEAIYGGAPRVQTSRLVRSYRSTYEITCFGAALIALDEVEAIQRHGAPVRVIVEADREARLRLIDTLAEAKRAEGARVCCLAVAAQEAEETPAEGDEESGLLALEQSKGLEYDVVILGELPRATDDAVERARRQRRLYVAATRALHELIVVCDPAALDLLPAADAVNEAGDPLYVLEQASAVEGPR